MLVDYARDSGIRDELDGVGTTSVFGGGDIIVVWQTRLWVEDDVLQDGAVANSVVNFGLL